MDVRRDAGGGDGVVSVLLDTSSFRNEFPVLTAREAAARYERAIYGATPTERHDTIRRRVQDLEENYGLLTLVSEDDKRSTYRISPAGLRVKERLDRGEKPDIHLRPEALARARDRDPSHKAVRRLTPMTDFHRVLRVFAGERP